MDDRESTSVSPVEEVVLLKKKDLGRLRDVTKKLRVQSHEPGPSCNCKRLKCFETISNEERSLILKDFNQMIDRNEQNTYLASLITVQPVIRRRVRGNEEHATLHDCSYGYRVRVVREGVANEIPVCFKGFRAIHGITSSKIEYIQKSLKLKGTAPKDKRGTHANRPGKLLKSTQDAIDRHIKSFKGRKSHYSLNKTKKIYLPEELNIKNMFLLFKEKYPNVKISYETYRTNFKKYNISFGYPRSDTCSTCDKFLADLKALEHSTDPLVEAKKKKLSTLNNVHKAKAAAFYKRKKAAKLLAMTDDTFEGIALDYQKNVSLPNVTTNDVYYNRQLSIYSFNVHILSTGRSVFYTYPETVGKKGSNEVISFLYDFVFNVLPRNVTKLAIFCDSAGGQNKNQSVFKFIHYLVHYRRRFTSVKITFPIRGHSYLECDKNFGLINLKTKVEIPEDWYNLLRISRVKPEPFIVKVVDQNMIRNWALLLSTLRYLRKLPFKIQELREIEAVADHPRLLLHRSTYNGQVLTSIVTRARNRNEAIEVIRENEFFYPEHAYEDHQFYHKWALLTDPDDIAGGPKGYLKCDISVIGKGDTVKVPSKSEKDEDDIEANLLLPDGVPTDRQRAHFIIKIYRADGLPKMNSSLMANVKKAFTGELNDLVDPFVQVSFAGLTGKTSVKKHSYAPVWNEQLVFTEMFPPLCQRIKIQLRDDDPVKPRVIGTHFVDLKTISNDGEKGFMPTFGPSFIHLYGSTRDYTIIDEHSSLNTGLGEGVSYRARLLISLRTEITDNIDLSPAAVELEPTVPVNEESYGKNEEFFLFTTILDASMIDKKLGDKPVYFEVSVGNAGNAIDGHNTSTKEHYDSDSDELETVSSDTASWQSTTSPTKPMTHDKIYYFLPYWDNKPCMHIRSVWPDYRRRMYNSNIIGKIAEKLEDGLEEVSAATEAEDPEAETKLKQVLEDLSVSCGKYVTISKAAITGPGIGKTKLDKERLKLCQREIEHIGTSARNLKALVTKNSFKDRYKTTQSYLTKLKFLTEDPQHSLPDVFLWIICGGKRQAYQRIPSRDIIYSIVDEERGKDCGKVRTIFLKLPGRKGTGPSGWTIPARLQIYFWLGMLKHKKHFIAGIPKGYEISQEIKNVERPRALPPSVIHYVEKHVFQLRAYIYQARSLIGSDASGLSDPFARVVAGEFCRTTQVIDETLSPTWDELLIFDEILLFGSSDEIKKDPPSLIIEIFDQDKVGKSEFIGRTLAKPHVKLREDQYVKPTFPPSLEWFTITRGVDHAGELLAAFELLEIPNGLEGGSLPMLPQAKEIPIYKDTNTKDIGPLLPVPRGIRPTLARYRIEVLFWGLRDLKRIHLLTVDKPRVDIECAGHILYSSIIPNSRKNPNFSTPVKFLELDLPEQELYRPPLTIRAVDCRSFGRYTLVGTHIINSIHKYMYTPMTKKEREAEERKKSLNHLKATDGNVIEGTQLSPSMMSSVSTGEREKSPLLPKDILVSIGYGTQESSKKTKEDNNKKRKQSLEDDFDDEEGSKDWWTKYFASVERMISDSKEAKKVSTQNGTLQVYSADEDSNPQSGYSSDKSPGQEYKKRFGFKTAATASRLAARISPKSVRKRSKYKPVLCKVYPTELESRSEFHEFKEWLHTFELYRGKKTGEEYEDENRVVGYFKGAIKVYKWPLPKDIEDKTIMGFDPQFGFFQGIPSNDPIRVLVRVYIVKANDLHPMDLNGKADPYIVLQLGSKRISDKDNYISKQLNPVFGKCFEIEATFPQDSLLTVQIYDWDLVGSDDMVGETKIDLENRFYSKHRATCGLPENYEEQGYNAWRDAMKPTQILTRLCKDAKVDPPVYSDGQVKVGNQIFSVCSDDFQCYKFREHEEHMALAVLHRWHEVPKIGCHLVPEHVETRPLYNPDKPGIEQGKLEMWVDMFPMDMPSPGPPLDISPRKPKSYELRVIIWNTDDVVLEDDAFFTGEKMSDIYVKGWLKGPEDCQCTDIHYRSLTGEGNFNWRFIFPFDYLVAEQKIVISRKESLFSWDETECKIPARLELQVWDADHFSADDFLGAVTLDLNRFPRGAKSSKLCTLDMLKSDDSVPIVNIFKQKRVKGWWPFYVKKDNEEMELTGKVEAEIHLLTTEEAEKVPVGLGRNEPDPLEKPNRPDSSFMWFMNPIKSIRYILWHNYKWTILKLLIIIGLAIIILLFFYSIPGYTVKKMLGA